MDSDAFYMRYLRDIQNIPGDTAKEKLSWIGKLTSKELDAIKNLEQFSLEVLSILQVEAAVKHKRHEDITSALKSDDWTIVNRALKATWFFDGSQEIINAAYFSEHVFPYISHYTKTRVVCTFARCVRNPSFAKAIFNVLAITYNAQIALSLLIICDQEFIYETIIEKRLILPVHVFEKIYHKNPELGVRLLKEYIGHYEKYRFCTRQRIWNKKAATSNPHTIIQEYKRILHTLAKKRSLEFIDIVQNFIKTADLCSKIGVLSKKCAVKFLKKAKNAVIEYSYIYMPILPSKVVSAELMEMMFPSLIKYHCRESYSTDKMLNYLQNFPEDKKFEMLSKTYRNLYQHELLDKLENVTPALLKILSIEKRIEFIEKMNIINREFYLLYYTGMQFYETDLTCYLPVREAIPLFKNSMRFICKTPQSRLNVILKMIYTCKVNKDEYELCNVLLYIIDGDFINDFVKASEAEKAIRKIFKVCEVPFLNKRNGSLLCHMMRLFYIKYNYVDKRTITHMLHFRLIKDLPISDILYMLVDNSLVLKENMFNNPQCQRQLLIFIIDRAINIYSTLPSRELKKKISYLEDVLSSVIIAMYTFNEKWCKNYKHTEIKPLRITNYPVLMDDVISPLFDNDSTKDTVNWKHAKKLLRRNEPDLCRSWCMPHRSKNIADVTSRAALCLLKNNFQSILNNWEEYLTNCKKYYLDKRVQSFVRATRWYKDIPIKFAERCLEHLNGEDEREMLSALVFLGLLLHGNSLAQLLESIRDVTDGNTCYNIHFSRILSIMISNSSVPFKLFTEVVLKRFPTRIKNVTLLHIIPRFSVSDFMSFAENISTMSVKRQICLINLICLIAPVNKQINFLCEMWKIERDLLVQKTLFEAILMLARDNPCLETALLLQQTKASFSDNIAIGKNLDLNRKLHNLMPSFMKFASDFLNHSYVWKFFYMWLEIIANYGQIGYEAESENLTKTCLKLINPFVLKFNDKSDIILFQAFLFHENYGVSKAMQDHALPYLLYNDVIRRCVINMILPYTLGSLQRKYIISFSVIRYNVYLFLEKFLVNYKSSGRLDYGSIIEDLLNVFATESLKQKNFRSFLLVEYARIMYISEKTRIRYISEKTRIAFKTILGAEFSNKQFENFDKLYFGYALGRRMHYLVEKFTLFLVHFMAEVLVRFLKQFYKGDSYFRVITYIVTGLLIDSANTHSRAMATMILTEKHWKEYDIFTKNFEATLSSNPFIDFFVELSNKKQD